MRFQSKIKNRMAWSEDVRVVLGLSFFYQLSFFFHFLDLLFSRSD